MTVREAIRQLKELMEYQSTFLDSKCQDIEIFQKDCEALTMAIEVMERMQKQEAKHEQNEN